MSEEAGPPPSAWRWLPDAGAIVAVGALVVVKCWNLVRPWEREYRGGDFALSIEPHFSGGLGSHHAGPGDRLGSRVAAG